MSSKPKLPSRLLGRSGLEVSVLAFGASPLGGVFQPIDEEEGIRAVEAAFQRGINFFDTSPFYGDTRSERVLGKALKRLPRDKIVVATKVGRYGQDTFDFSASRVTASIQESLTRLQLEYVDLIQCHDIEFGDLDQIIEETLPALAKLREKGLVKNVGITGLPLKIFTYILDRVSAGSVDVILSYCHHTLTDSTLEDLLPYLKQKGVGIINASPLCMGLFTAGGPPAWHPAPESLKVASKSAAEECAARGVSISKLALQHSIRHPDIATTLVGMCTVDQVNQNCDAALLALGLLLDGDRNLSNRIPREEEEALNAIQSILAPVKNISWSSGRPENN